MSLSIFIDMFKAKSSPHEFQIPCYEGIIGWGGAFLEGERCNLNNAAAPHIYSHLIRILQDFCGAFKTRRLENQLKHHPVL